MGYRRVDPTKVAVSVNLVPITGWADGDMITIEYDDDFSEVHSGTQGEYAFILKPGRKGEVMFRVASYSPANAAFTALSLAVNVAVPFIATDKSSNADVATSPAIMLKKPPAWVKSDEATMNEWTFNFGEIVLTYTGAEEVDFI